MVGFVDVLVMFASRVLHGFARVMFGYFLIAELAGFVRIEVPRVILLAVHVLHNLLPGFCDVEDFDQTI